MKNIPLYIDNQHYQGSGKSFNNYNPATGEIIHEVSGTSPDDFEKAIASAKRGFKVWSAMSPTERGRILHRASQILRERNDELAHLEMLDAGKPIREALEVDVISGADCLEYYAGIAASLHGDHIQLGGDFAYTRREPLGICAGIGAWNYPIQIACWKAAPALACGNVMIFKPAELTPLTAFKLGEIFTEAGLPDGVFNVIQGDAIVGQMMTGHPDIAKVSITGEVGTGKAVMAASATTLKKVTLELGGKSPIIVFDDADLDEAVFGAMLGNFYTQGEICSNGTRVYVHESVKDAFMDRLIRQTQALKVGDPADPETRVGALISKNHFEKVMQYISLGTEQGAELACGGQQVEVKGCEGGYFVEPTIFVAPEDNLRIVEEEIFGPVMTVLTFSEEEEVLQRANNTPFGLAAGVFTKDLRKAHRMVAGLEAGMCWINTFNINPVEIPFGGYKQSGIGRENGLAAIEHYTQLKTVYVAMDKMVNPF
ncbi:betaine-aldehyde dehydrogenase [Catalinimonas alkaloidigena]|uniref:betaine-aldehyde dehydrogenase n=1 Tax=Catalinimonas alkaloidigena TaxID=1075417 RepID=UPI002405670A|nr:betaine-aldehyde dehydrogenase [Catalinimonas alkaloidigena]MDF9795613.1 betaine-aldehyde dehydrogenase [Catalinimonas alkaloidigena]